MKNREQRRREKFGRAGKVHQHDPLGPWPDSEANPALRSVTGEQTPNEGDAPATAAETSTDEPRRARAKPKA
jgi:hypothetical protein